MNACEELVGELNAALTAAYRLDKMELKDIKKQAQETENIMSKCGHPAISGSLNSFPANSSCRCQGGSAIGTVYGA